MLDEHLLLQRGAANLLSPLHQDRNVLRSKIKLLQLEISNKDQKIRRLESAVSKIGLPTPIAEEGPCRKTQELSSQFVQTANLVMALVHWGHLKLDHEKQSIVDDYATPGNDTIAGSNLAEPFFDWLAGQEDST